MPNANATYHLSPPTGQGKALMHLRAKKLPTILPSLSLPLSTSICVIFLLILWRLVMYSESSWRASAQTLPDGWRKQGKRWTDSEWCISQKECYCSLSESAGAEVIYYCILIYLYYPLSVRQCLKRTAILYVKQLSNIERKTATKALQGGAYKSILQSETKICNKRHIEMAKHHRRKDTALWARKKT